MLRRLENYSGMRRCVLPSSPDTEKSLPFDQNITHIQIEKPRYLRIYDFRRPFPVEWINVPQMYHRIRSRSSTQDIRVDNTHL
jgi:hypothetical protein